MSDAYVAQVCVNGGDEWRSTEYATLGEAREGLGGWARTGAACRVLRIPDSPETHLRSYNELLRDGIAQVVGVEWG